MLVAATGGKALWYLTRGTGLVAGLLLTASVVLGILEVRRWQSPRWPRFVTAGMHRYVSLLSVAFVAIHVATTVIDGFAPIGWLDAVIPFHSPYRPLWLGLGAVSSDLLLALVMTSLVRGRLGYRAWRAVHWAAYACWPAAFLHGLGTGTDVRPGWAVALNLASLAAIVGAVWWRLAQAWGTTAPEVATGFESSRSSRSRAVLPMTVASVVTPIAIVVWLLAGPLQPGWSRRAGTPTVLHRSPQPTSAGVGAVSSSSPPPATTPASTTTFALASTSNLQGRVSRVAALNGQATDTFDTTLSVPPGTHLVIVLRGRSLAGGGIAMSTSQVSIGPPADRSQYRGTVTSLQGPDLTLAVSLPGQPAVVMRAHLTIGGSTVSGTLTKVSPGA
jgi:sulfoxide reductase heme-binding subunit YedZ